MPTAKGEGSKDFWVIFLGVSIPILTPLIKWTLHNFFELGVSMDTPKPNVYLPLLIFKFYEWTKFIIGERYSIMGKQ